MANAARAKPKPVAKSEVAEKVIEIVNIFDNQGEELPRPDQKLWDIGIGPNSLWALAQPLTKVSHKYEGKMVTGPATAKASKVSDLIDVTIKAINAGGKYEVK